MAKASEVTRHVKSDVERELWGRAAGRCQFSDCNKLLYKHGVTQQAVNLAEKAHIYSFSKNGPRGWGPFKFGRSGLNDVPNLLLVCHDCHKLIDDDKKGEEYSAELLMRWKAEHEARVRVATSIPATKRSHVVLYGSRIGEEQSPLGIGAAFEAMFPDGIRPADRTSVRRSDACPAESILPCGLPQRQTRVCGTHERPSPPLSRLPRPGPLSPL